MYNLHVINLFIKAIKILHVLLSTHVLPSVDVDS